MSQRLADKIALITGSSRGIGRAVALAFAKEGAALIGVHYIANADAAKATVRDIEALGVKAVAVKADLRQGKNAAKSRTKRVDRLAASTKIRWAATRSSCPRRSKKYRPAAKPV